MRLKGLYTIEAALIMPLILLILVTIIEMGIYLHDKACLQAITNEMVFKMSKDNCNANYLERIEDGIYFDQFQDVEMNGDIESSIMKRMNQMLIKDYENVDITLIESPNIMFNRIELIISVEYRLPIICMLKFFGKTNYILLETKAMTKEYSPTELIRTVDFIDDLTNELILTKEVKDIYFNAIEKIETTIESF